MVGLKGRTALKQYVPLKLTKRGFKVWTFCDSHNGFICNFEVYTGADGVISGGGLGSSVIKSLSSPFHNSGHHLFFDNYFLNVNLLSSLLPVKTYCIATTQTSRREWSRSLKDNSVKKSLSRGQHVSKDVATTNSQVNCIPRCDKSVAFVNTICDSNTLATVSRRNKNGST